MTFSDFAKMMYPFIGGKKPTWQYIIYLTSLIMEDSLSENTKNPQHDVDDHNPLSEYVPSTLTKYYNGSRNLSIPIAREIISHLDKSRLYDYLISLSNDTILLIGNALKKHDIKINNFSYDCIVDTCVDTFVEILYDCALKDSTSRKHASKETSYKHFRELLPEGCNMSFEAFAQLERNRIWWQRKKENDK